jgi:hypothetical protein
VKEAGEEVGVLLDQVEQPRVGLVDLDPRRAADLVAREHERSAWALVAVARRTSGGPDVPAGPGLCQGRTGIRIWRLSGTPKL